jgi:hypothetical protein
MTLKILIHIQGETNYLSHFKYLFNKNQMAYRNQTPLEELAKRFLACGRNNVTLNDGH